MTVREDFLEVPADHENLRLWISNLYVTVPRAEKNHTTLIGVHGGDVYLTDMTFVADGEKARAVDVKENSRVYVGRAFPPGLPVPVPKRVHVMRIHNINEPRRQRRPGADCRSIHACPAVCRLEHLPVLQTPTSPSMHTCMPS